MKVKKQKTSSKVLDYTLLLLLTLIVLGPFLIGIWTSFLPTMEIAKGNFLSLDLSLNNYIAAFKDTSILRYLGNSIWISLLTMLAQLILCSMSAYALVFLRFPGRNVLFILILITMMLPFEAQIIPNFMTIKASGLLNSYSGMIVPFLTSAFGIFMLRQSFLQMPDELKEAADIEGLNHLQFYWKVALPYNQISLITLGAYSFLGAWNQYLWPMLTTFSDNFRPVQNGLRQLQSQETFNDWGMIQATAVIVVVPTLIVLFVGQHYFKSGMNEGAVK